MQGDLVERCAEAAWQAESRRAGGRDRLIPWAEEGPDSQEAWRDTARSIIPIVLEEAAKVANDRSKYFDYVNIQGDKYTAGSPYDRGAEKASQDIEAAIRAKMENLT